MSSRNNPYFDNDVKKSPSESKQIRSMESPQLKRALFLEKVLLNLLNWLLRNMEFLFAIQILIHVEKSSSVIYLCNDGATKSSNISANTSAAWTIIAESRWKSKIRDVHCGIKRPAIVRDALINDSTTTFPLSVWGDLMRKIISDKTYKISSVTLSNFNGPNLSTSFMTEITEVKDLRVKWDKTSIKNVLLKTLN